MRLITQFTALDYLALFVALALIVPFVRGLLGETQRDTLRAIAAGGLMLALMAALTVGR
jgi:hypothetical protein